MTDTPQESSYEALRASAIFAVGYLQGASGPQAAPDPELSAKCRDALLAFIEHADTLHDEEELSYDLIMRQADLLTRTANALKGQPTPLSSHSHHDLPEVAAASIHPNLAAIRTAAVPFDIWWAMVQAQEELAEQPIPDSATILHFMGSGASTMVTAKHLRDMMNAIALPPQEAA